MLFSAVSPNEPPQTDTISPKEAEKTNNQIRLLTIVLIAAVAAFVLYFLGTHIFAPTNHYRSGIAAMERGDYADAIASFTDAGNYKDAAAQIAVCRQKYADQLAGKENAVSYLSSAMPWTSIDENGAYAFQHDAYEKAASMIPDYGTVIIPDVLDGQLVQSIKEKTFLNADTVTAVTLPNAVTTLPDSCFYNCHALSALSFGKSLSVIEQRCFLNCTALETLTLPQTVTSIGLRAFNNCYSLTAVHIPGALSVLMPYTFSDCYCLREISLPASLEKISEYAFTGCSALETIYFAGSEAEWKEIEILEGNEALFNADIIFAK